MLVLFVPVSFLSVQKAFKYHGGHEIIKPAPGKLCKPIMMVYIARPGARSI